MSITQLLLICLSVWRLSHFLSDVNEDGPYDIAHKVRSLTGVKYNEFSEPYGTNVVSKAILCVWCSSFWFGLVGAIVYAISYQDWRGSIWLPMATSGFSVIVETWVKRD